MSCWKLCCAALLENLCWSSSRPCWTLCCAVLLDILCWSSGRPCWMLSVLYCWRFFAGALAGLFELKLALLDTLLCCWAGDILLDVKQALLDALLNCFADCILHF